MIIMFQIVIFDFVEYFWVLLRISFVAFRFGFEILPEHQMFNLHWTNDQCQSRTIDQRVESLF